MDLNSIIKLIVSILASFAAGGVGSLFTFKAIPTWYAGLKKPRYTPPNRAFGPVWTTLYILMGISVFLVWQGQHRTIGRALINHWFNRALQTEQKSQPLKSVSRRLLEKCITQVRLGQYPVRTCGLAPELPLEPLAHGRGSRSW